MKTFAFSLLLLTMVFYLSNAQNVEIPDTNFLNALMQKGVDTNEDGEISYSECEAINNLTVSEKNISDLTGIEAFVNLDTLDCSSNQLTSLDVSGYTALEVFNCAGNQLTSLDVSGCNALIGLDCYNNQLTSLDISKNAALESLNCEGNQLTSLDVSNNTDLVSLKCSYNQLTSLDVSNDTALLELRCYVNQLTSLDVSGCNALELLECQINQLTSLDVSKNTALNYLDIRDMPTLTEVCVWTTPFPPNTVNVDTTGCRNVCFQTDCNGVCGTTEIGKINTTELSIYPNPTNDLLIIETDKPKQYSIELTSLNGQLIYSSKLEEPTLQIDLSKFQKGVYFITVRYKDYIRTEKIIKL